VLCGESEFLRVNLDLKTLIGKLNPVCRSSLEAAASLCVSQTNYNVEIEHFLLKLLDAPDSDLQPVLRYYALAPADLARDLTAAIERFPRGNARTPALSRHLVTLFQEAWLGASLRLGAGLIRSGAVLLALLDSEPLRGLLVEACPLLFRIARETFGQDLPELVRGTAEDPSEAAAPAERPAGPGGPPSRTPALDQFTIDLTARARAGGIDPIQGRDAEIRQIIDILMRRRQNNPILTGEAGVGKTAIVEGFARRVAGGDVPPALRAVAVRTLDVGLLQAGAGIKGEFEQRLKSVIAEVKASPRPIILFIDEAHTLIGAGGPVGQSDAANLLKPALARGELRTIAATTWAEYKKYFEKDAALARRFQVIKVDEPDEAAAARMLRGVVTTLEQHHRVRILDEAVRDAVKLSHRYITGRQLPDKAISVLDTACARVAVGQHGTPAAVEDARRRIERLEVETDLLRREQATGRDHAERLAELAADLEAAGKAREELEARWQAERGLVQRIQAVRGELEAAAANAEEPGPAGDAGPAELGRLEAELAALQGEEPMVPLCVDSRVVASVVSGWTGIPVGRMLTDEVRAVLDLKDRLAERLIGQPQALEAICGRIRTYRASLDDPGKPVGVFLLVGPSGVGKTETALALADLLYGGERSLVTINMSEYQEAYTVSGLKGSPPGYVGYGQGGVLTEAVRRTPYCVVLLDEVEKAHPDVLELFYQVFDKGTLEDSEGTPVDFRNTLILLTSNLGAETILHECRGPAPPPAEALVERLRPELLRRFKPALLGRLVIVPFYPLGDAVIREIVRLKLARLQARFRDSHRAELSYDEALVAAIAARCGEVDTGARNVDHILTHTLLPDLSAALLERLAAGRGFARAHVSLDAAGSFAYAVEG
jgi:type VI secretion system protein VasG